MKKRLKREIRRLVCGVKDPRRGFGTLQGLVRKIVANLFHMAEIGFVLMFVLAAPLVIPFGYIGNMIGGFNGMIAGSVLGIIFFLIWVFRAQWKEAQIEFAGKEHDYQLCLWCHHPIAGLTNRGRCPECGKGFDLAISQKLYKAHYTPPNYLPAKKVLNRRIARLWARAVRERDRNQES